MSKILVTGATGNVGRKTLQKLLDRRPANELIGLVRDPARAADLAAQGIEIRQGDYFDHAGLVRAFTGVEKVLLVPSPAFTDRSTQHYNVITAAKEAGVRHILYTPMIRPEGSDSSIPEVTGPDLFTLQALRASGLEFTIAAHPPFTESLPGYIGANAVESGIRVPAGAGRVGAATYDDLAEAQAVLLTEPGHENRNYSLHGTPAVSFAEIAGILSDLHGTEVAYSTVTEEQYVAQMLAAGLPESVAVFLLAWVRGINTGEWDNPSGDLEKLLGRKPTTVREYLRDNYLAPPER